MKIEITLDLNEKYNKKQINNIYSTIVLSLEEILDKNYILLKEFNTELKEDV